MLKHLRLSATITMREALFSVLLTLGLALATSDTKETGFTPVDFSGCTGGHRETSSPYFTDARGQFVGHTPPSIPGVEGGELYLAVKWRGHLLHLALHRHALVPRAGVAEWEGEEGEGNLTVVERLQDDCFYQGQVRGQARSFVAVSICDGITGYIQTADEGVYIEPVSERPRDDRPTPHTLHSCYRNPKRADNSSQPELSFRDTTQSRVKRAPHDYTKYLEVLLVADTTVVNFIGKNKIKQYLLGMMNIVNAVYRDESLGTSIEVVTVKLQYMDKTDEKRVVVASSPQRTVDQFCDWVSTRNTYRGRGVNHDVAVLLSRHKFGPAGYAPITGMCVPGRSCAFVKDDGFTSAFVIAHEMAHVIGLMHDGQGNACSGREYTTSIMATMVQSSFSNFWWSSCSRKRMKEVIGRLTCLNNNPLIEEEGPVQTPIGISWSLDQQCKLEFGDRHVRCAYFGVGNPCDKLWCAEGRSNYRCTTKNASPLEGTQCGPTAEWWCSKGACSYHGNEKPLDGGWGQWSSWSDCSSECGVGFKRRSRKCTSPEPHFGGKDCEGESDSSDTCRSTGSCTDYSDIRALQCSAMDDLPLQQGAHTWFPFQVTDVNIQCQLTCVTKATNQIVTFDLILDNGTPCSYDNPNNICLDGKCLEVGCDGIKGSRAQEDECGVCEGDGSSCKTVEGVFSKVFKYSAAGQHYEQVVVLPGNARNVEISETATSPHFLAVEDTGYYRYVLNGDGAQGRSRQFALEGAWFDYTNNRGFETLKTKGPLQRKVNVKIYPMDHKTKAGVKYKYTVDKSDHTYEMNKFAWKFENWSACSVSCGTGSQYIVYGCYDKDTDTKVDEEECQYIQTRDRQPVECKRLDCSTLNYRWRMSNNYSACSKTCGEDGTRFQLYQCEDAKTDRLVDKVYCTGYPEPVYFEPCANPSPCVTMTYKWVVTSRWVPCSATCGDSGVQWQAFYCGADNGTGDFVQADDRFCSDMTSPKETRACNREPCVEFSWVPSPDWQACTEECGQAGRQWRFVQCRKTSGNELSEIVSDRFCVDIDQPRESRPCNRVPCFRFLWSLAEEWSECSHTCGRSGVQQKKLECQNVTRDGNKTVVKDKLCERHQRPAATRPCNREDCPTFRWVPTYTWSECSVSCGSGTRSRLLECRAVYQSSSKVVPDESCGHVEKPNVTRRCSSSPCRSFVWEADDVWSPCNATCEMEGRQLRNVSCVEEEVSVRRRRARASNAGCDIELKPASLRECERLNCSSYSWSSSDRWSDCSTTCGQSGVQTSLLKCILQDDNGTTTDVEAELCDNVTKPESDTRPCTVPPCISYREDNDADWSDCSVTCGGGVQHRKLDCIMTQSDGRKVKVEDSYCSSVNVSRPERPCNEGPCVRLLEWGAGDWSLCSKTCGRGQRKRQVYCGSPYSPSPSSQCPGKAPSEYSKCNEGPCNGRPRNGCVQDRAAFCRRATSRLCKYPAYVQVCCKSCQRFSSRRRRRMRTYRRRHG